MGFLNFVFSDSLGEYKLAESDTAKRRKKSDLIIIFKRANINIIYSLLLFVYFIV